MDHRLIRLLFAARYGLLAERIWPGLSRIFSVLLLGIGFALFGLPGALPGWLHLILLLCWVCAIVWLTIRAFRRLQMPTLPEAIRQVERRQAIPHRALSTLLLDQPSSNSPLWGRHLLALQTILPRLRWPWPMVDMAVNDPFALRLIPILLTVIGFGIAGRDSPTRLIDAINPGGFIFDTAPSLSLDAWITPPDYTGLPPIMLAQAGKTPITGKKLLIPQDSRFYARINGSSRQPNLVIDDQSLAFAKMGDAAFQREQVLTTGQTLAIERSNRQWVIWAIEIVTDQPPSIALTTPPAINARQMITLDYAALDDYAVTRLSAEIDLVDKIDGTTIAPTQSLPLSGAGPTVKRASGGGLLDLLAHPWAGLPVTITLKAQDGRDQQAKTETLPITLPSRAFAHPTARQLIAWRRDLTLWPQTKRGEIANQLAELAANDAALQEKPANIIALSGVLHRLRDITEPNGVTEAQDLMWQMALSLDNNHLTNTAEALAKAKSDLEQALNDPNRRSENFDPLITALEQALSDLQAAVIAEFKARLERGESLPEINPGPNNRLLDQQTITDLIQKLRDQTDMGSRQQARQLLQSLNNLIDQARQGMIGGSPQPENPDLQAFTNRLRNLSDQQQSLTKKTGQSSGKDADHQALLAQQQELRRETGDLMLESDRLALQTPPAMGDAERAMKQAEQSLAEGKTARALQYMAEANDALAQSLKATQSQSSQNAFGQNGTSGMAGQGNMPMPFGVMRSQQNQSGEGRDPLGRQPSPQNQNQGQNNGSDVNVPAQSEAQRAREILDELRRRAGGMTRPALEQDYLKRLLEQF
jgi:uncharacterized protein (TIGR02302 family)